MTREEATEYFKMKVYAREAIGNDIGTDYEAYKIALSALRPVSRERVEKVWKGEWIALDECANEGVYCSKCKKKVYRIEYANEKMKSSFCPHCGAPMTDEAVDMMLERWKEAFENG